MRRFFKVVAGILVTALIAFIAYLFIYMLPVMTGMDAKVMCSCVFVADRNPESVQEKELQVFPGLTLASIEVDRADSSVTATLLGRTSKAIYRRGLGCTLLAERGEEEVRAQRISRPLLRDQRVLDTIAWPLGNRLDSSRVTGLDYDRVRAAVDNAFAETDPEKPMNTHAVVVLYDGKLIAERYAEGMDHQTRMMGWSMTKSIASALIGILVKEGKLRIDDPAPIDEWQVDNRKRITINDLLHASSGLSWQESYFIPTSDFHRMFIRSDDKAGFAASREAEHKPGGVFEYSSGTTNILSRIIRQETGDQYYRFPYEKLFHRCGMYSAILEPDASGTFVASSYGFASARDWARFGLLYLNDGVFNGERILPEGWVKYSTTPAPGALKQQYGAQIWLNAGNRENPSDRFAPDLPTDAFFFEGFEENSVTVIPSRKLVVVRLGVTHGGRYQFSELVRGVMDALPSQEKQ